MAEHPRLLIATAVQLPYPGHYYYVFLTHSTAHNAPWKYVMEYVQRKST